MNMLILNLMGENMNTLKRIHSKIIRNISSKCNFGVLMEESPTKKMEMQMKK